jgi:hypothetical protein
MIFSLVLYMSMHIQNLHSSFFRFVLDWQEDWLGILPVAVEVHLKGAFLLLVDGKVVASVLIVGTLEDVLLVKVFHSDLLLKLFIVAISLLVD